MRERLAEIWSKGKSVAMTVGEVGNSWWTIGVITSVAVVSFSLGRISKIEAVKPPVSIERAVLIDNTCTDVRQVSVEPRGSGAPKGAFVASDSGTKYYPVGCAAANRVTAAHRIYFTTSEAAVAAGYSLAASCVPK